MYIGFKIDRRMLLWQYAPVIFWIGVIFFLSSDHGSMPETSRFIRPLLQFLFPAAPEETLQIYHSYVRKAAHFTEYAVLAFLALRSLAMTFFEISNLKYLLALATVVLIASIDELNQSFEISRTGSVRDVLLDISGGLVMIAVLWLVKWP